MFNIKVLREEPFGGYICIAIQSMVSVGLQLFIQPISYNIAARRI